MKRTIVLTTAVSLFLVAPAGASRADSRDGAEKRLHGATTHASGKAATSSSARAAARRRFMPIRRARRATRGVAYIGYLNDVDAHSYGARGCKRLRFWSVRCIGYIRGNGYNPAVGEDGEWLCDWYQRVWYNPRNRFRTSVRGINCRFL